MTADFSLPPNLPFAIVEDHHLMTGGNDKIRNHLLANPIHPTIEFVRSFLRS